MNLSRNLGFISQREQLILCSARVAIAGVGGDGGQAAETLARLGVQNFALADPEEFTEENLNRQNSSFQNTLGLNKAGVLARTILAINPNATIDVFPEGVTEENVESFMDGADIVIDETEFTFHHLAVMVGRQARKCKIPVVTGLNIGFGAASTSFDPEGMTVEAFLGLPESASLPEIQSMTVPLDAWVPRLPSYVDIEALEAVVNGELPAPSVAPGVALAAGMVSTEVVNHLLKRRPPVVAPAMLWFDALELEYAIITDRKASFEDSLLKLYGRPAATG